MIQKKICLLGGFAVGKTSLIKRQVHSAFSEKYLTTLGVKIDRKVMTSDQGPVTLMLWDLAGEDEFMRVRMSYLRGSAGIMYVVDGTRGDTLETVFSLKRKVDKEMGEIPSVLLVNKSDLERNWDIDAAEMTKLTDAGWIVYKTSALDGQNVNNAFQGLVYRIMESGS